MGDKMKVLNIELKSEKFGEAGTALAEKTIDAVKNHGLFDKLLISSFSAKMLIESKKIDRNCKTAFLYSPKDKIVVKILFTAARFVKGLGVQALHPHFTLVTPQYVKKAHALGIQVNPWTVNKESDIRRMIKCGVDGIITDYPEVVHKIIDEMED